MFCFLIWSESFSSEIIAACWKSTCPINKIFLSVPICFFGPSYVNHWIIEYFLFLICLNKDMNCNESDNPHCGATLCKMFDVTTLISLVDNINPLIFYSFLRNPQKKAMDRKLVRKIKVITFCIILYFGVFRLHLCCSNPMLTLQMEG